MKQWWIWQRIAPIILLAEFVSLQTTGKQIKTMAQFDQNYTGQTKPDGELSVYVYTVEQGQAVRITMRSNNTNLTTPLLSVFREPATIMSTQLPLLIKNHMYNTTSKTICPFSLTTGGETENRTITLSVELNSYRPAHYEFSASIVQDFELSLNASLTSSAAPAEPVFYFFQFPPDLDSVVIWVDSNSSICMTVIIQQAESPFFNWDNRIIYGGLRQTVTKAGSLTVERRFFEKFFVIFVVRPNDDECSEMKEITPPTPRYMRPRRKTFTVSLQAPPTMGTLMPFLMTMAAIGAFYIVVIVFAWTMGFYERRVEHKERTRLLPLSEENMESDEHASYNNEDLPSTSTGATAPADGTSSIASDDIADGSGDTSQNENTVADDERVQIEENMGLLQSSEDTGAPIDETSNITGDDRQNVILTVADLSAKSWEEREKKNDKYVVSHVTVALVYALPVVQYVLAVLSNVRLSGNLDLCWYNFRCARPFSVFFAFNNILSNIGYPFLGILFLGMVRWKEYRQRRLWKKEELKKEEERLDLKNDYGLPQHNGINYAIAVAIFMEGVMSASYHICPSYTDYQFDTSFMYIMGVLGILRIYQMRHPDNIANAHVALLFAAAFILLAMLGVYLSGLIFWILFSIAYVIFMLAISLEFYFKGLTRRTRTEIFRSIHTAISTSTWLSWPAHKTRLAFLVVCNVINLVMVIFRVVKMPQDFPSVLLFPFIANLILYMAYYIIMKLKHGERLRPRAMVFLVSAVLSWPPAVWFFWHRVTDWSVTPAASRESNQDCILMQYYDNHDLWHFLSSIALFMTFSFLDCIDDDLQFVRRDTIAAF